MVSKGVAVRFHVSRGRVLGPSADHGALKNRNLDDYYEACRKENHDHGLFLVLQKSPSRYWFSFSALLMPCRWANPQKQHLKRSLLRWPPPYMMWLSAVEKFPSTGSI